MWDIICYIKNMKRVNTMKKIICLMFVTVLLLCGCAKQQSYNLEVTSEPFETLENIGGGMGSYPVYDSEKEMYDDCDLVVVAMPINTYTDEEILYFNYNSDIVAKDDEWMFCETIRKLKIIEILKGDTDITEVKMAQMGGAVEDQNGNKKIVGTVVNDFIQKQNAKYLYYLKKSTVDPNYYYSCPDQGVINVDGLDSAANEKVMGERIADVMATHRALFEKYDRKGIKRSSAKKSTEYNFEVGIEKFEQMGEKSGNYMYDYSEYETEEELYEASDLVIVGMPKNTLTDDKRMYYTNDDRKGLLTEDGEVSRVCTVRDIQVVETLKGDAGAKSVPLIYESGLVDAKWTGKEYIIKTPKLEPISKKNVKYIYYLKLDLSSGEKRYRVTGTQSTINVDGLHSDTFGYLTGSMAREILQKYSDIFVKYDRTDEK